MREIDARGLSCPEPVLLVQNALKQDDTGAAISVDNMACVENIRRFAEARGYAITVEEAGREYRLRLTKP